MLIFMSYQHLIYPIYKKQSKKSASFLLLFFDFAKVLTIGCLYMSYQIHRWSNWERMELFTWSLCNKLLVEICARAKILHWRVPEMRDLAKKFSHQKAPRIWFVREILNLLDDLICHYPFQLSQVFTWRNFITENHRLFMYWYGFDCSVHLFSVWEASKDLVKQVKIWLSSGYSNK